MKKNNFLSLFFCFSCFFLIPFLAFSSSFEEEELAQALKILSERSKDNPLFFENLIGKLTELEKRQFLELYEKRVSEGEIPNRTGVAFTVFDLKGTWSETREKGAESAGLSFEKIPDRSDTVLALGSLGKKPRTREKGAESSGSSFSEIFSEQDAFRRVGWVTSFFGDEDSFLFHTGTGFRFEGDFVLTLASCVFFNGKVASSIVFRWKEEDKVLDSKVKSVYVRQPYLKLLSKDKDPYDYALLLLEGGLPKELKSPRIEKIHHTTEKNPRTEKISPRATKGPIKSPAKGMVLANEVGEGHFLLGYKSVDAYESSKKIDKIEIVSYAGEDQVYHRYEVVSFPGLGGGPLFSVSGKPPSYSLRGLHLGSDGGAQDGKGARALKMEKSLKWLSLQEKFIGSFIKGDRLEEEERQTFMDFFRDSFGVKTPDWHSITVILLLEATHLSGSHSHGTTSSGSKKSSGKKSSGRHKEASPDLSIMGERLGRTLELSWSSVLGLLPSLGKMDKAEAYKFNLSSLKPLGKVVNASKSNVKEIDLQGNQIFTGGDAEIVKFIQKLHPRVEHLNLEHNGIDGGILGSIVKGLEGRRERLEKKNKSNVLSITLGESHEMDISLCDKLDSYPSSRYPWLGEIIKLSAVKK